MPTDAGGEGPETRVLPPPAALPLGEADLLRLGEGGAIDMNVALCRRGSGFIVAWDRFDATYSRSTIVAVASRDLRGTTEPAALALGTSRFVANPSCVGDLLYFARSSGLRAPGIELARVSVSSTNEEAVSVAAVSSLLGWPRFAAWGARTLVAFRDGDSVPSLAVSEDGLAFTGHVAVGPPGALANASVLGDGGLIFTYQRDIAPEPMVSFFRVSADGVSFGDETRVTDASPNVHDTSSLARADGGVDLYYIYPSGPRGFRLFRRAVSATGARGPEEAVTSSGLGEPSKPVAARASDGTVLLAYADIAERDGTTGEPTHQILTLARVAGDAPAPP